MTGHNSPHDDPERLDDLHRAQCVVEPELSLYTAVGQATTGMYLKPEMERARPLRDRLNEPKILSLVGHTDALPSVPTLYLELLEELRSPSTTFKSIAGIISRDVAMTAKILQLVNSAFFGFYRNITSVEHAVGILGMRMIRSLVLSVKIFQEYSSAKMAEFPIDALMQHCVSTGALARIIGKSQTKEPTLIEDVFMAGMLHDVGKLVLADKLTHEYAEVKKLAEEKQMLFCDAEREKLGVTHAEVGAYLMSLWGLPDNIVETVAFHHEPLKSNNRQFGPLTVVHVANVFEHNEHSGPGDSGKRHEVDMEYLRALNMADRVDKWSEICHVVAR